MNTNNEETKSEHSASDTPEAKRTSGKSDQEIKPDEKEKKAPPSRTKKFLRQALIWLTVIAIAFLAGFLIDYFLRYRPLSDAMLDTQAELEETNQELSDLGSEVDQLTTRIQEAEDDVASMQEELALATARLKYYQVLVDVNSARIGLFLEEPEVAEAALVDTQQRLDDLLPYVIEVDTELALSLPRRLELIIAGLERDPETARIDLELFTKDLLELEPLLFDE